MVIRHVGVWSVSRLYGALLAAMGLLIGGCFALIGMVGGMSGAMRDATAGSGLGSGALGMMFGVGAIIFLPLFYGVLGLVSGAIAAVLYNLFAGMFGGIQLDVEP
jgi:hypothetical protein